MIVLLYFISFVLVIIATAQMFRVYEQVLELKGGGSQDIVVSEKEGRWNAILYLLYGAGFFAAYAWLVLKYKDHLLPVAASVHGVETDRLLAFNFGMINLIFFITVTLLCYFPIRYYFKEGRKALYYTENHKLELVWTIVPAIAMAVVIIWGLKTWNEIFSAPPENAVRMELYARQFDWTARYAGEDGRLGGFNYRLIGGMNALGLKSDDRKVMDDKIVKGEFHLPVNRAVDFEFRSQDVIHSAYMPHFRAQMNCVPGMTTRFNFIPTKTTEEMRTIIGNPDFDYLLLCNKICGVAHYNMQMKIIVESQEDYDTWLAAQKTVGEQGIFAKVNDDQSPLPDESLLVSGE